MRGDLKMPGWAVACMVHLLLAAGCRSGTPAAVPQDLDGGMPGDSGTTPDGSVLEPPDMVIRITAPKQGAFIATATVQAEGATENADTGATLTVNGLTVAPDDNGHWAVEIPLDVEAVANPILAELARTEDGALVRERVTVIAGGSIVDGDFSAEGLAVRINDSALDSIEAFLAGSVTSEVDLATLIPVGTRVIDDQCFIDGGFLGCLGRASVDVATPAPSFAGLDLQLDAKRDALAIDTTVSDMVIHLDIVGSGLVPDYGLTITASQTNIASELGLRPDPSDANEIDVSSLGAPVLSFSGFVPSFSGARDAPIIGDIIRAALPDLEPLATDARV